MHSVSPVLTEKEVESELVIALEQKEYYPIIIARIRYTDGSNASLVRYKLTDKEREVIAKGADLIISQPHHGPFMPIGLQLAFPNEYPFIEGDLT